MFKNTRESISKIIKIYKIAKNIFNYGLNGLMIIYLSLAISFSTGNFIANLIILPITVIMFVLSVFVDLSEEKKTKRKLKGTKHIFKWGKILTNAFSLGVTLYGMFIAASMVSPLSIILTTLLIIMWIIKVMIEVLIMTVEHLYYMLENSVKEDLKWALDTKTFVSEKAEMVKEGLGEAKVKAQETIVVVKESSKEWGAKIKNYFKKEEKEEVEEVVATEEE